MQKIFLNKDWVVKVFFLNIDKVLFHYDVYEMNGNEKKKLTDEAVSFIVLFCKHAVAQELKVFFVHFFLKWSYSINSVIKKDFIIST